MWWRRTGIVPLDPALSTHENQLRVEESEALLIGGLLSLAERWVDDPYVVMRAEHSLLQLAAAGRQSIPTPTSLATNDPEAAKAVHATGGRWIAKATSAGVGIAPFADYVDRHTLDLLPHCMTLIQQARQATADLRVVIVGDEAWCWERQRSPYERIDWRSSDPEGSDFRQRSADLLAAHAVAVNDELGLRFSVQDWLLVDEIPIFLEVNPSGQWLFLEGARNLIGDALARLLIEDDRG